MCRSNQPSSSSPASSISRSGPGQGRCITAPRLPRVGDTTWLVSSIGRDRLVARWSSGVGNRLSRHNLPPRRGAHHPQRDALSGRQDAKIATSDTKIESMRFEPGQPRRRQQSWLAPCIRVVDHVPVAPDHVLRQQCPSRLAVRDALHGQRFSAGKRLQRFSTAAPGSLAIWSCRSYTALID